jgi:hypothetical protein
MRLTSYYVYVSECGNLGYKGSQNGICAWRQDEESITEQQGSQNEPLWELNGLLAHARVAQAELRPCLSGLRNAQECSPSAQVKAAAAHV